METRNSALRSREFFWIALLILAISYISMPREQVPGDSVAARCEAIALLKNGSLAVPSKVANGFGVEGQYFFKNEATGRSYSKYGILNTLVYVPLLYAEKLCTGTLEYDFFGPFMEFNHFRTLALNIFNILCALATAAYLFKFASLYTASPLAKAFYILPAFYCTFWWDHLRIQSFEAYQPLLLIGASYHFIRACNSTGDISTREHIPGRDLFCSGLLLGLLWLSKASYILMAPLFALFIVVFEWKNLRHEGRFIGSRLRWCIRAYGLYFGIPLLICFAALLAVNSCKFGSPFNNGYNQWTREQHMFSGDIVAGVLGFLFDPQFSIFLTFPVLVIAVFGVPGFFRKHRRDAEIIYSTALLLLLLNAKFLNWRGLWSYGPRYMLPVLGMMSLPLLPVAEKLIHNIRKPLVASVALLIVLVLGYSAWLQMNVNALKFYTYFYIKEQIIDPLHDPQLDHYFATRHFGLISGDILAYKHGKPLWFRERFAEVTKDKHTLERLDKSLSTCYRPNYYLFPDNE